MLQNTAIYYVLEPFWEPVLAKGTGSALQFLPQASNALPLIHSFIYSPLHYAMLLDSTRLDSTPRNRNHRDLYSKIAAATASKQLHSAPEMAPKMSLLAPLGSIWAQEQMCPCQRLKTSLFPMF